MGVARWVVWAVAVQVCLAGVVWGQDLRIENEYKLTVPGELTEQVWEHLRARYENAETFFSEHDGAFRATFADELFFDQYFDTPELTVLKMDGGVRHRRRFILDGNTRKHGRELVQVKLARPGDLAVNRTEIKFDTRSTRRIRDYGDAHPVLGLVKRSDRKEFRRVAANAGIDADALRPTLLLQQRRRRVYVLRNDAPFATITLDEVSTTHWWKTVRFTELEMELNEIGYTEADEAGRAMMQAVNDAMKRDLLETFPAIKQDQTPKYTKMFKAFGEEYAFFETAMRLSMPFEVVFAVGAVGMAGATVVVWRRRRMARLAQQTTAP